MTHATEPPRREWDLFDVELSLDVLRSASVVLVPHDCVIVYDGRGWSILPAPPRWWLDAHEELHDRDTQPAGVLSLVPPWRPRTTACRPGAGPCRRRHLHASQRGSGTG
jgi:hypothetical protein